MYIGNYIYVDEVIHDKHCVVIISLMIVAMRFISICLTPVQNALFVIKRREATGQ